MMNRFILLLTALFALTGCQDLEKLTEFDMKYSSSVTIANSTGINLPFNLLTPDIETNSESEFAINDTRKDLVEEIRLTSLVLTITSPQSQDFSFLKSIAVYIRAEGLEEVEVASLNSMEGHASGTLVLEPADQDLQEYIKQDEFVLRIQTVTDELVMQDVTIDIASGFFVNARVLGL